MNKEYEAPMIIELGEITDLTGSGGFNNDDGWGWGGMP